MTEQSKSAGPLRRIQSAVEGRAGRAPWSVATAGLLCFCGLFAIACVAPASRTGSGPSSSVEGLSSEPWMRVLLVEDASSARIAVSGLCSVLTADAETGEAADGAPVAMLDDLKATTVRVEGAAIVIEGQARYSGGVVLRPKRDGAVEVEGRRYRGELCLRAEGGKLRVINALPLEDYLCGVLPKEMPLSFPGAALEAQAVAARTYALFHARRRRSGDHDVKNDTRSQVYGGLSAEKKRSREVIERTRGQVLTYQGGIFQTYFHSTCGGETIPAHWVFGGEAFKPLSGAQCGRCLASKYYRWEKAVSRSDMIAAVRAGGHSLVAPVKRIEAVPWDRGLYQKLVRFEHEGGVLELPAPMLRRALKLRSAAFDWRFVGDQVQFSGAGWGHGVGMCQYGARGHAEVGASREDILSRYYPGSELTRIY